MRKIALFLLLAVGCCANAYASAAITSPYSNEFPDEGSVLNHIETLSGQWSVLPSGKYQNQILSSPLADKSSSSMLQFNDLGGLPEHAKDFSLSATFTVTNLVGYSNSVGFAILASNADATVNSNSFYLADVFFGGEIPPELGGGINNASLRFEELGTNPTPWLAATMLDLGKVLSQGMYLLQLEGTYDANNGDLNLRLDLTGENDTSPISFPTTIPSANVLTGNHFGFRNRASGGLDSALTVEYDSLNITAIPEPSSIGFVAASLIGGYAAGRYWRRRQAKLEA